MKKSQAGFLEVLGALLIVGFVALIILSIIFVGFHGSQSEVSGIVYNTEFNHAVSGNTTFSVRAGIDTYVNESNESDFCLPKGSPYTALIKKAAADKSIKVDVVADKYFALQSPFTCHANVTVTEEK